MKRNALTDRPHYSATRIILVSLAGLLLLYSRLSRSRGYLNGLFTIVAARPASAHDPTGANALAWKQLYALHGTIQPHRYSSRTLHRTRGIHVYAPPGYDPKSARRYPALYLLHGSPGDDANWTAFGNLGGILDHLIAEGKCEPMVVVMPNNEVSGKHHGVRKFEKALLRDILPWTEATYRVRTDAAGRAIVGLSMEGFYSIFIGLNYPDVFGWVGVFRAGLREDFVPASDLTVSRTHSLYVRHPLKLLYERIGRSDFFLNDARRFHRWLEQHAIGNVYRAVNGAHEWPVWRGALEDLVPRLFQK